MSDRPKTLPPTLRDKYRYIAFQVISEELLKKGEVKDMVWSNVLRVLGEVGTSMAKPWLIKFDEKSQTGIIRCDRNYVEYVRFSLALITEYKGRKVLVRTLGVSGTIRRLKKKFLSEFGWR
ncbi:ribonuclease P protein component 2 [Thermococcus chitonophagus]|uniref:Ribonuclease P protein component 2 n=1 Tax=Thermococcus chitonophagus TaxID=54262 RepID=A0A161KAN0_9EURY|nr:ribonuclease P protein component 2 [Thermococcus chitonophagus]ASJ16993.1 ribonuclease P protein component 2 [Thermococcus chitonophagus]CUX78478.1 Ribonuclease P protein component 2 [Thermococcus chitonophagus]